MPVERIEQRSHAQRTARAWSLDGYPLLGICRLDPQCFREETYDSPFFDPEAYLVAPGGGQYVSLVRSSDDTVWYHAGYGDDTQAK